MTDLLHDKARRSWGESVRLFFTPKVLALLFLGFSAGVPLYLVFSTLSVWLREAGVERATIGFFSWAAFHTAESVNFWFYYQLVLCFVLKTG